MKQFRNYYIMLIQPQEIKLVRTKSHESRSILNTQLDTEAIWAGWIHNYWGSIEK